MPRGRPRKHPVPEEEARDAPALASSAKPTLATTAEASSSSHPPPIPPPTVETDTNPSTPESSGRRTSSRRSARKVVNYRTHFDLALSDDDEDAKAGSSGRRRRRASSGASSDEFRPDRDAPGEDGGDDDDDGAMDDEDDEVDGDAAMEEEDEEEDDGATLSRSTKKGAKSSALRNPSGRPATKAVSSATKKPLKTVSRTTSKSLYPAHERRPLLLAGEGIRGGYITSQEILPLSQVGVSRPPIIAAQDEQEQLFAIQEVRQVWSARNHYTHTKVTAPASGKKKQGKPEDILQVIDTSWFPGKTTSAKIEAQRRAQVKRYWQTRDVSLVDDIQVIGGLFLLGANAGRPTPRHGKDKVGYDPPPSSSLKHTHADFQDQKDVKTFVEHDPILNDGKGGISVLMGSQIDAQHAVTIEKGKSKTLKDCNITAGTSGFVANCGSYISSIDWAPSAWYSLTAHPEYLAVGVQISCPSGAAPSTVLGQRNRDKTPGVVQIWSLHGKHGLQHEYSLGIPLGEVVQVKWCPVGFDLRDDGGGDDNCPLPRIGILACALSCGKIALYAMPRPDGIGVSDGDKNRSAIVEVPPILELPVYATEPTCIEWAGGERLLAGTTSGSLMIWHTGHLLRSLVKSSSSPRAIPSHSVQVHEMAITSASFLQLPPRSSTGIGPQDETSGYDFEGLPHFVLTTGLDGSTRIVDLDTIDVSVEAQKQREPGYATSFLPYLGMWLSERGDNAIRIVNARPGHLGRTHLISSHQGRSCAIDASMYHPLAASGAADGTVTIIPSLKNVMKNEEKMDWPVYRLEINRATGQLRYIDNYTLTGVQHGAVDTTTLGAFHPSVRISAVAWCKNLLANPFLLASASAAGLLRIDLIASDPSATGAADEQGDVEMQL